MPAFAGFSLQKNTEQLSWLLRFFIVVVVVVVVLSVVITFFSMFAMFP